MFKLHTKKVTACYMAVAFVLALGAGQSFAAASVTLDEAVSLALQNNPSLQASSRAIGISEGERRQAGLIPNPELSWEMEDTRSSTRTTTVQISQPIELGGKRAARIELAERGMSSTAIEQEQVRNELRAGVIQAFHGALQARMQLELAEKSQLLSERGVAVVESLVKAGKASQLEVSRARLLDEEVRLETRRARNQYSNALAQLQLVMGTSPGNGELTLTGEVSEMPGIPLESELLRRLEGVAQMRLAKVEIERQDAGIVVEKSLRVPDLTVSLGSQYSSEDRERINLVGLSMPIPLFDRNQGNLLAANRRADQARDLRNATELRLRGEVQQALLQWGAASDAIAGFEGKLLDSADAALESTTRGFQMGKFAFIDVLDAQRTLIDVRTRYLQSLSEALDAWVRLERIYGDLAVSGAY
ncbi:TolC family protein [Pseudomonas sp. Marseille-Q0931]|uniref:TolC family protein n=1 Tax=Pseudomonas sp. Marseille-Q0931 TaxID=2697507 RepID=UPI0023B90060|nr:TolC family protein [Pseudomonas sp. Marseille-Q0931]